MKTLIASFLILSSMSSFAAEVGAQADAEAGRPQPCLVRDLSLAQQTEIKKISDEASEKIKPLSAELKAARDLLNRIMQNPQAAKADAVNAKEVLASKALEIKAILSDKNIVESFDILSPEQRVKQARCLAALRNPRAQLPQRGQVIVRQPVRRPQYRPSPYPRFGGRVYPSRIGRYPRRIFP